MYLSRLLLEKKFLVDAVLSVYDHCDNQDEIRIHRFVLRKVPYFRNLFKFHPGEKIYHLQVPYVPAFMAVIRELYKYPPDEEDQEDGYFQLLCLICKDFLCLPIEKIFLEKLSFRGYCLDVLLEFYRALPRECSSQFFNLVLREMREADLSVIPRELRENIKKIPKFCYRKIKKADIIDYYTYEASKFPYIYRRGDLYILVKNQKADFFLLGDTVPFHTFSPIVDHYKIKVRHGHVLICTRSNGQNFLFLFEIKDKSVTCKHMYYPPEFPKFIQFDKYHSKFYLGFDDNLTVVTFDLYHMRNINIQSIEKSPNKDVLTTYDQIITTYQNGEFVVFKYFQPCFFHSYLEDVQAKISIDEEQLFIYSTFDRKIKSFDLKNYTWLFSVSYDLDIPIDNIYFEYFHMSVIFFQEKSEDWIEHEFHYHLEKIEKWMKWNIEKQEKIQMLEQIANVPEK